LGAALAGGAVLLIAGILIGNFLWRRNKPQPPTNPLASVIKLEPGYSLDGMRRPREFNWPSRTAIAISHEGTFIVYCAVNDEAGSAAKSQLFMRRFESLDAKPIPETEGGIAPFLSPDDRWVGFWADGRLKKVPVEGGLAQDLCEVTLPYGASWGDDERIVFSDDENTGLFLVSSRGGTPEVLTKPDSEQEEFSHHLPSLLPGGKNVLFTIMTTGFDFEPRVAILDGTTRKWHVLLENASDARYIPTGHIAFMRKGTLMAVPFDLGKLAIRGQPVPITPEVMHMLNSTSLTYNTAAAQYAISDSGSLVCATGGIIPNMNTSLVWIDRTGNEKPLSSRLETYFAPRLSPDGRTIVYQTLGIDRYIWIYDIERDISTTVLSKGYCMYPIWTQTGKGIVFSWINPVPPGNIYLQSADGSTAPERLTTSNYAQYTGSLSPDGGRLAFVEARNSPDILVYNFRNKGTAPFASAEYYEGYPEYSPDGRWLAYCTDQEGRFEVYVRSSTGSGETVKISREGGIEPLWARSGKQLFFRSLDRTGMMVVDVQSGTCFSAGKPSLLFEKAGLGSGMPNRGYDISSDDQRFLMVKQEERKPRPVTELILIQNWFEELKRLAPAK
jgi:serine/threonine-protein kinase